MIYKIGTLNISSLLLTACRIAFGLMWLENALWKGPLVQFGLKNGQHLYYWVQVAIKHPTLDIWTWFLQHVVLTNFIPFGWAVYLVELALAGSYMFGLRTRFMSLIAIVQITAITLSALRAPNEWHWSFVFMYIIACVYVSIPPTKWSLDRLISYMYPRHETVTH